VVAKTARNNPDTVPAVTNISGIFLSVFAIWFMIVWFFYTVCNSFATTLSKMGGMGYIGPSEVTNFAIGPR